MKDKHRREIDYLRVSVTDRCNLRCFYCMPEDGVDLKKCKEILSYEELFQIIKSATELGIKKIRLTGGEPLIRKGLIDFIERINELQIEDLALTTNGTLLPEYAGDLARAGLDRVNISLDTMQAKKFSKITRSDYSLSDVKLGVEEAQKAGLNPVKLNIVLIKGINVDEVEEFARLTLQDNLVVRFIELMPLGESYNWAKERYVSIAEIKEDINQLATLEPVEKGKGNGPAKYYKLPGAKGKIGFISPMSDHYCKNCNRIRLTADGFLKPCLHSDKEFNIKEALRNKEEKKLQRVMKKAIFTKPKKGLGIQTDTDFNVNQRQMSQIGG